MFNRIKPIRINGNSLKGTDYVILASSYTSAINNGSIPIINDAWTEVVENQLRQAIQRAYRMYTKEIKKYF